MKHEITKVNKSSIANELNIKKGDYLVSINGNEIKDIFDYRYYLKNNNVEILIEHNNEHIIYEIEKEFDEELGLFFKNDLMDNIKKCKNKCVFCFIDQLPPSMRKTLYVKDDDIRLSFLNGNYVTLTNVDDKELDRIIKYHLSPINISVHATCDHVRKKMMQNKNAGGILENIKKLINNNILVNAQIVLVKGYNDKDVLKSTLDDILRLSKTVNSLSIVPVGITKFRKGLVKIEPFNNNDSKEVIEIVNSYRNLFKEKHSSSTVYVSDEWYIKADLEIPEKEYYEEFAQLENGVGLVRLFIDDVNKVLKDENRTLKNTISIVTGESFFPFIKNIVTKMNLNDKINVYKIVNNYFGNTVTVSGLITAQDIIEQLRNKDIGKKLLLPNNMFRDRKDTTLDNYNVKEIERSLDTKIEIVKNDANDFMDKIFE